MFSKSVLASLSLETLCNHEWLMSPVPPWPSIVHGMARRPREVSQLWALLKLLEASHLIFCHILKVTFLVTYIWNNLWKLFHMSNFISFNFLLVESWHLKMFCLSEHFPLWWCIILPEGFMAGLHKANIFPPYVISPWQTEMLSHLITEPAWHMQRVRYSGGV